MAMAAGHESPDMTTLWPVRKRLRRDSSPSSSSPQTPTNNTATADTSAPFFGVHKTCGQKAAHAESAGPGAARLFDVAGDDDTMRVPVVFARGGKARARGRPRTRTRSIQQYYARRTTAAEQTNGVQVAVDPWNVAIPTAGTTTEVVDPLWIVRRLTPPTEPPASPVNAILEAELRVLVGQMVGSGEVVFRFCTGAGLGTEHIECSDALTAWVFQLLREGTGDRAWLERVERLVYKVLFEYIVKLHFEGNGGGTAGPMGAAESMSGRGQMMPKEQLLDILLWLKGVAEDPCGLRDSGALPEWQKWGSVNMRNHRGLAPRGSNCLNPDEYPDENNAVYLKNMVLCIREALFVQIEDLLPTEDFPYRLNKQQKFHQYLSGTFTPDGAISPDNMGSSLINQSESGDCSASNHRMLMQPPRRLLRSLALLRVSDCHRKRVPVGPDFQADVPEWKGPFSEKLLSGEDEDLSDSKKFGTQIWPIDRDFQATSQEIVGKGRVDSCVCPLPRSVSCVRYHVSVGRLKMRWNLGQAFNSLGLNEMGEDISDSWTLDEERIFGALVKLNPLSEDKSFWEPALKLFGSKSRQNIVSYYFNVFVLRRMGIQTRFLGGDADSDDDEVNVDGYEGLYPRASHK